MSSLRDRVASAVDGNAERVSIPEWDDVELEIRSITVKQRAELLKQGNAEDGTVDLARFGPLLVVGAAYDPATGQPAFSYGDVDMLAGKNAGVVDRLAAVAMRVSGLQANAVDAGKGVS